MYDYLYCFNNQPNYNQSYEKEYLNSNFECFIYDFYH